MEVVERVKEFLDPIAEEKEYFIVDILYKREGGNLLLRVSVDKKGGITMDECAGLNNEISAFLEKENIIDDRYIVEVSSPGLTRKLKTDREFTWAVGRKIRVTTYAPLAGKNVFEGVLGGLGEGTIVITENDISTEIPRDKIANAKLAYDK